MSTTASLLSSVSILAATQRSFRSSAGLPDRHPTPRPTSSTLLAAHAGGPCGAGFELALGLAFATLLTNGSLMVYDVASGWTYRNSVVAAESSTCTGATYPRMVMGHHRIFLLFPLRKEVVTT